MHCEEALLVELAELVKLVEDRDNGSDVLSEALQCESRSSVVDKVLGMLGYNAAPTFQKTIALLSEAIASLLLSSLVSGEYSACKCKDILESGPSSSSSSSSSCSCKQHVAFEEKVFSGSCVSRSCLRRVAEGCGKIIGTGHGTVILPLIEAVLKVAVGTCLFRRRTPAACSLYVLEKDEAYHLELTQFVDRLVQHKETYNKLSSLSRLHAWRLHPMLLKQDLSNVVLEALQRPFLLLGDELKQQPGWKRSVTCLATSPLFFSEARRLLHSWMASIGLSHLWHILAEVIAAVRNAVVEPSDWGFTDEMQSGLLPFYLFYPPGSRNLVKSLAGPCTESALLEVVSVIHKLESSEDHSFSLPWPREDSIWSLLVSFPEWFYLALRTIFQAEDLLLQRACAKYVALVIFPSQKVLTAELPEKILEIAGNWQRINKNPTIAAPDSPPVQPPCFKRVKTERKSAEVRGETTMREAKAWIEAAYQLFQHQNRSSKASPNILQQLFCLAPVFADSKLLDREVGMLFIESVVRGADKEPTIQQGSPSSPSSNFDGLQLHKSLNEPAHRTERFRGGGLQWIPGMLQFLRRSSSRMQQSSVNAEAANRCILELAREWLKPTGKPLDCRTPAEDLQSWFPGEDYLQVKGGTEYVA